MYIHPVLGRLEEIRKPRGNQHGEHMKLYTYHKLKLKVEPGTLEL